MNMKRCINGHFYDPSKHDSCPYCQGSNANANIIDDENKTIIPGSIVDSDVNYYDEDNDKTQIKLPKVKPPKTKNQEEIIVDPVVGWLVCIDGVNKGKDYSMHSENNYIGRDQEMDICVIGDENISRKKHAIISFDPRTKKYYFSPGSGRNIVRLNNQAIFMTNELKYHDIIELGETKFIFVPLCDEDFTWQ